MKIREYPEISIFPMEYWCFEGQACKIFAIFMKNHQFFRNVDIANGFEWFLRVPE